MLSLTRTHYKSPVSQNVSLTIFTNHIYADVGVKMSKLKLKVYIRYIWIVIFNNYNIIGTGVHSTLF